jgi:hypothetical protein
LLQWQTKLADFEITYISQIFLRSKPAITKQIFSYQFYLLLIALARHFLKIARFFLKIVCGPAFMKGFFIKLIL